MKRPLAIVALIYTGGILLGRHLPGPLPALFFLTFFLGLATLVSCPARPWILCAFLFFTGWTNLVTRTATLAPHDLRVVLGDDPKIGRVRGWITESPSLRRSGPLDRPRVKTLGLIEVRALELDKVWQPALGQMVVNTEGDLPAAFCRGREVLVSGVIARPRPALAPGLFDYARYLEWKQIYYQIDAAGSNDWVLVPPVRAVPWTERFNTWAQEILGRGLPEEDEPLRLLWAMALGWKTALTDEVSEPFMQTGTMHIFAISGLHIALIAGILVSLLRVLQIPRGICGWIVIPLIWAYTAATGWQASAIRSTIMMTIVIGGWALERPGDLLNSLAASAFIILLWQPQQLFQASFQLSFFVVLSLALLSPHFQVWTEKLFQIDPFLPPDLRPRWQRWIEGPARLLLGSLVTSLAAWIGSLPLVAYYFHLLTPSSLLANLLVVPLSSLALMSNLGSLLCNNWLPACTVLFNYSAWFWMDLMVRITVWAAARPAAYFYVRAPGFAEFAIYYGIVFWIATRHVLTRRLHGLLASALVILSGFWLAAWFAQRNQIELTLLPARGGDAIYFRQRGKLKGLIDGGDEAWAERVTKPFLHAQGVNRLDALVLTHGDSRHVGGFGIIDEAFHPGQVVTSFARFRSPAYRAIEKELAAEPRRWIRVSAGDRWGFWQVLHPGPRPSGGSADDQALVLQADVPAGPLLLLSDLGTQGQKELLASKADLRSDIVVAGLPAKGEPLSQPLLEAAAPRLMVVNSAAFPASQRPSAQLQARLARTKIPIIYAHESGALILRLRPGSWTLLDSRGNVLERNR